MKPIIETINDKKVVGLRINTCVANHMETFEMWGRFMPKRNDISSRINNSYLSIQVMDPSMKLEVFTEKTMFEKWAAVEVSNHHNIPDEMEPFTIPGGKFAVFTYTGLAKNFGVTMREFFTEWLPQSGHEFDPTRPRFEVLEENYVPTDPNAQEVVWIPVI